MYIHRHIENVLKKAEKQTKVVLLTGARQVGKSTTIQQVFGDYTYITLDNENELNLARTDRQLFFRDRKFPVIIDEVQYEKELFRTIKYIADKSEKKGRIFITGSQTYELLSEASESLAGRVSILEMSSLSCREQYGVDFYDAFIPTKDYIKNREAGLGNYDNIWEKIWRGFMPELLDPERDWSWFYRDYIRTYIERDVRKLIQVQDELKFRNFLTALAARTGQVLVYANIARDVGIDIKTAQHWTSVVAGSGLIHIIHPFYNNATKRAIKSPKIIFADTGLVCYLVGWKTSDSAMNGVMAGELWETFVTSEIIKSFLNAGKNTEGIYYYRDKDKREIDLLIDDANTLYPIEIKKGAAIDKTWTKNFSALNKLEGYDIADGVVICRTEEPIPINEKSMALPVEYI